ncbi:hypothetical protein TcG_05441, partial [Trypanosoma cruzi]
MSHLSEWWGFFPSHRLHLPRASLRLPSDNTCLSFLEFGADCLQLLSAPGERAFSFCKKAAGDRNVRFARRWVVVLLFHPQMRLNASIPHVCGGVGAFRAQALPFNDDEPLMDPNSPGSAGHLNVV